MAVIAPATSRFPTRVYRDRLSRAAGAARARGIDALLITPSADYLYLLGYRVPALPRLTCLVISATGASALILPRLEEPLARHELGDLADDLHLVPWSDTDDPIRLVRSAVDGMRRVGVQDQMWARFVLRLLAALEPIEVVEAGPAMNALRRRKGAEEIERLRAAAAAADQAMEAIAGERLTGRSEAEVSRRINELLLAAGHETADFAIVASGPNSASPHHTPGERVIALGDAVVLDVGGTRNGYCSDTTRTAFIGEPPAEFAEMYAILHGAQEAAVKAVAPGVAAREVDRAAREVIEAAGQGEAFIHRTGHGIGLETHEEPFIVASNAELLEPGDAFSVEPGIYIGGRWGARIEDIVVCTESGGERLNLSSRGLLILD